MKSFTFALVIAALSACPAIAAESGSVDGTIAAAHQAAHDDHNAEAARLYEEAIAAAPERRLELLPELSDQLTYSGRAADAVPLYREVLRSNALSTVAQRRVELGLALALSWSHNLAASLAAYQSVLRSDPRDIDALLGVARVLSWQDQLSPSLRVYKNVLVLDPGNREAKESMARVQNWRGRHFVAQRLARALLSEYKKDPQATATLAQSELWMGRPDLAARDDDTLLSVTSNDPSARAISADIRDTIRQQVQFTASNSTQSDGLLIRSGSVELDDPTSGGLSTFGIRYQPIAYTGLGSAGDAVERRFTAMARERFNDNVELHAAVGNDDITSTGSTEHGVFLYNTYLTVWPNDSLRFDFGSRRETFDNLTSLRMGIAESFNSASVDFTPDENTKVSARGYVATISDGNREGWEQLEVDRTVDRRPNLSFGGQATSYSFESSPDNGYYDPPRYQSLAVIGHIYSNVNNRLYYDGAATYGHEWAVDGGNRPTHSLHAALSYVISRPVSLSALYDSFDTRQISNGGFARTTLGLQVQSKW